VQMRYLVCPKCGYRQDWAPELCVHGPGVNPLVVLTDPTPDPLAEVRAHHAKGGRVQARWATMESMGKEFTEWSDCANPSWIGFPYEYRIAPAWVPKFRVGDKVHVTSGWPTFHNDGPYDVAEIVVASRGYRLAGVHHSCTFGEGQLTPYTWTLPPGDWHRVDWTEDMLPEGYRPLLLDEKIEDGDERNSRGEGVFFALPHGSNPPERADEYCTHFRTRRPLPSTPRVEMPKIKTRFIHPPIPIRNFDWEATRDGYDKGDPIGFGRTEALAIADLEQQEETSV
jgi:hypothetical protein